MDKSFIDNNYQFTEEESLELPQVLEIKDQDEESDSVESTHTDIPMSKKSSQQNINILHLTSLQTRHMMSPQISKKMPTNEYSFDLDGKVPNTVKTKSRQELPANEKEAPVLETVQI